MGTAGWTVGNDWMTSRRLPTRQRPPTLATKTCASWALGVVTSDRHQDRRHQHRATDPESSSRGQKGRRLQAGSPPPPLLLARLRRHVFAQPVYLVALLIQVDLAHSLYVAGPRETKWGIFLRATETVSRAPCMVSSPVTRPSNRTCARLRLRLELVAAAVRSGTRGPSYAERWAW
jgi:hypothetical protein